MNYFCMEWPSTTGASAAASSALAADARRAGRRGRREAGAGAGAGGRGRGLAGGRALAAAPALEGGPREGDPLESGAFESRWSPRDRVVGAVNADP